MRPLKLLASLFVFVALTSPGHLFGQEQEQVPLEVPPEIQELIDQGGTFTITARVNVYSGVVMEQINNDFSIEFEIQNDGNLEPEVLYAVQLYKETEFGEILVDEKVYPEVLTIRGGERVKKQIRYSAPGFLDGEYIFRIVASNKKGLEYGGTTLGTYTVSKTGDGQYIDQTACALLIEEDDPMLQYGLTNGVDVRADETLLLECQGVKEIADVSAQFVFRERSSFADVSSTVTIPFDEITFTEEGIVVGVPLPQKPQSYVAKMTLLTSEGTVSNDVAFRFVVQGASATIKNASLDKASYNAGDTATVKIVVSGYADVFPGARERDVVTYDFEENAVQDLKVNMQINSASGVSCSEMIAKTFPAYESAVYDVSVPILEACANPKVIVEITSADGTVLSEASFDVNVPEETSQPLETQNSFTLENIIFGIALLLTLGAVGVYVMYKYKKGQPTQIPLAVLAIMGLGMVGMLPAPVSADSFVINYFDAGVAIPLVGRQHPIIYSGWYQLANNSIPCNGSIVGQSRMKVDACDNVNLYNYLEIDDVNVYYNHHSNCNHATTNCGNFTLDSGWRERNVGAKTTSGSTKFDFRLVRDHTDKTVKFDYTKTTYSNYTVGSCTPPAPIYPSCSITFNPTALSVGQTGTLSITVTNDANYHLTYTCTGLQAGSGELPNGSWNQTFSTAGTKSCTGTVVSATGHTNTCSGSVTVSSCSGSIPSGSTMCPGDDTNLMTSGAWTYKGSTEASCNPAIKCEYYTIEPLAVEIIGEDTVSLGSGIRWTAQASGGVPPYTSFVWSGVVSGPGTPVSQSRNFIDARIGTVGPATEHVTVYDSSTPPQSASDTHTTTIVETRRPQ